MAERRIDRGSEGGRRLAALLVGLALAGCAASPDSAPPTDTGAKTPRAVAPEQGPHPGPAEPRRAAPPPPRGPAAVAHRDVEGSATAERRRVRQLGARVARLYREAGQQFRREDYANAAALYAEIVRIDPADREAVRLAELARRSSHRKRAARSRRDLIEQWQRTTESLDHASRPMTGTVQFPSEEVWREVDRRAPREQPSDAVVDRATATILERLRRTVTLSFSTTPLTDAIRFLSETSGINIVVDPALLRARSEDELAVDLRLEEVTVGSVLTLIADLKRLRWRIQHGVVFVSE